MEDFIKSLLMVRTVVHMLHLSTSSYSEHKALETLYNDLNDDIDDIIECHQGDIGQLIVPSSIKAVDLEGKNAITIVSDFLSYVKRERETFQVSKGVNSLIDNLETHLQRASYRLKFLK
jgi:hypothetical protein